MQKQSLPAFILMFALLAPLFGQSPSQSQDEPGGNDQDVVRITTNLIQVDAVVTDKNGKPVTDLTAEDFEIQENGKEQKITNFSFIPLAPAIAEQPQPPTSTDKNAPEAPPLPPVTLRRDQVRRTIALVVDDLGLSAQSIPYVRRAFRKFVEEQMQPGDLVAILRTSGVLGLMQQFTSNKQLLLKSVEAIRWNPLGRGGISPFLPIEGDDIMSESRSEIPGGSDETGINIDEFSDELFTVGTLGTLNYIVQGLKDLPGRKSVMLFSDGIKIRNSEGQSDRVRDDLRRLADNANRASVVIYTLDAKGLPVLELTAADNSRGLNRPSTGGGSGRAGGFGGKGAQSGGIVSNRLESSLLSRRMAEFESQQGMNYLADETGGLAMRNSNDVSAGIKKMLDDQQGYYLIGYHPDEKTFDPDRVRFNKLTIKVKRSGFKVRYRSGFIGYSDKAASTAAPATRAEQLARAITKPFATGAIDLRLTTLFANDATSGSYMRSLLHVDASGLTFVDEPDDWHKLTFDIMAVTFGAGGEVVDELSRTENVKVRGDTYFSVMRNGFDYILTVPVKKPGAYQLRAALRDTATERVGTASQFIEVPDLGKNRLAISGIIISGLDPVKLKKSMDAGNSENPKVPPEPQTGPGVRRLRRGFVLEFGYVIYNAQLDRITQRPQLQTQIRLYREGRRIFVGDVLPFDPGSQADLRRLTTGGRLQLGTDMQPGEYVLQIVVTDLLAKEKERTAVQWIDFEIRDK